MSAAVATAALVSPSAPVAGPAASAPILVRRRASSEIEEHTAGLDDWSLQYEQLDCGAFQGSFTDIRWPGMQIFVETTTRRLRQRGLLAPDSFGLGTLLSGAGELLVNGQRLGPDSLIAVPGSEVDFCSPSQCVLAGFVLESGSVLEAVELAPELDRSLRASVTLMANTPDTAMAPLRSLLRSVTETALSQPQALEDRKVQQRIRDDVLLLALNAMSAARESGPVLRGDARKLVVERACHLMLDQQDTPPTLLEVCKHLETSPRKLGYCFQDVLGVSPARYLKLIRMNAVRRELRQAVGTATSVYDVAARWGFWHFGHFSADYKKQFAELPSQTLRGGKA